MTIGRVIFGAIPAALIVAGCAESHGLIVRRDEVPEAGPACVPDAGSDSAAVDAESLRMRCTTDLECADWGRRNGPDGAEISVLCAGSVCRLATICHNERTVAVCGCGGESECQLGTTSCARSTSSSAFACMPLCSP